jgi:SAM-dependent methyltransferase
MKIENTNHLTNKLLKGYTFYHPYILQNPALQLNDSQDWALLDNLFTAQLIHATRAVNVLDFGCYLGSLPLLVEDLLFGGRSDHVGKAKWTLVDNFSFLQDLRDKLVNPGHTAIFPNTNMAMGGWKTINKFPWKEQLFKLPPTNPDELRTMLDNIVQYYKAPQPNIVKIDTHLDASNSTIFDMIYFDLSAGQYEINLAALQQCLPKLKHNGIIIFDDVKPAHPQQIALFFHAISSMGLTPIAFGRNKVAALNNSSIEEKNQFILSVLKARIHSKEHSLYYYWDTLNNPIFGDVQLLHL